jgi:hypothetical protein
MSDETKLTKWNKITLIISLVNLAILVIPLYFSMEANNLAREALELQNMQTNYNISILVNPPLQTILDTDGNFIVEDYRVKSCGWLNGSIMVITPHAGRVNIGIKEFIVNEDTSLLVCDKVNLTTVTFDPFYRPDTNVMVVNNGVNKLSFNLPLEAIFYLDPQQLTTSTNFTFPIGYLIFEITLNTQTGFTYTEYFDVLIFVVART